MVVVPVGEFMMGTSPDEQSRFGVSADYTATELPRHRVRIDRPYALGRFPVTRDEWAQYRSETPTDASPTALPAGCAVLMPESGAWAVDANRSWRDPGFAQTGREPVVCVAWDEATAYAAWLSRRTGAHYRLPTEAEWEYAARAGTTTANYWGDDRESACRFANASDLTRAEQHAYARSVPDSSFLCHDGHVFTAPVDGFPANAFGLYGMSGNVWQWVEDCYDASHAGAPADASARQGGDCRYRMDRGASWVNSPRFVRAGARHKDKVDARTSVLGLRLARDGGLRPPHVEVASRRVHLLQRKESKVGDQLGKTTGWIHRTSLKARGVAMSAGVTYRRIDDDGLHVRIDGEDRLLPVDHIVVCAGQEPLRDLVDALQAAGRTPHLIGGADVAAELDARRAIAQGTALAARI